MEGAAAELDLRALYDNRFEAELRARKDAVWRVLCAEFFQRYVDARADTLLDVGSGLGEFSRHMRAARKIAIDLNPGAAALVPADVAFHNISATAMTPVADGSVDVAFSSNFLEHLPDKDCVSAVLREIFRVLKPGGRYIAMQPNIRFCFAEYWDYWDHHVALSDRSAEELFRLTGLEVETLIPRFMPFTVKSGLPTHPALVSLYLRVRPAWRILGKQFLIVGRKPG